MFKPTHPAIKKEARQIAALAMANVNFNEDAALLEASRLCDEAGKSFRLLRNLLINEIRRMA